MPCPLRCVQHDVTIVGTGLSVNLNKKRIFPFGEIRFLREGNEPITGLLVVGDCPRTNDGAKRNRGFEVT